MTCECRLAHLRNPYASVAGVSASALVGVGGEAARSSAVADILAGQTSSVPSGSSLEGKCPLELPIRQQVGERSMQLAAYSLAAFLRTVASVPKGIAVCQCQRLVQDCISLISLLHAQGMLSFWPCAYLAVMVYDSMKLL